MIPFKDISYAQGDYAMGANTDPMVMIKMSGGDGVSQVLYYDSQAAANYNKAIATGKIPFMYHFYGGGDSIVEADWFIKACSPLAVGDGLAIDIERGTRWNPQTDPLAVAKVAAFVNHVHDVTGIWPWVYMNMSTANMYDWSPVFDNCGYWCAAPSFAFDETLPVKYPQIAQQGLIVSGEDTDMAFCTLEQLRAYTKQPSVAPPADVPQSAPVAPAPEVPAPALPAPVTAPTPQDPAPAEPVLPSPVVSSVVPSPSPRKRNPLLRLFWKIVHLFKH